MVQIHLRARAAAARSDSRVPSDCAGEFQGVSLTAFQYGGQGGVRIHGGMVFAVGGQETETGGCCGNSGCCCSGECGGEGRTVARGATDCQRPRGVDQCDFSLAARCTDEGLSAIRSPALPFSRTLYSSIAQPTADPKHPSFSILLCDADRFSRCFNLNVPARAPRSDLASDPSLALASRARDRAARMRNRANSHDLRAESNKFGGAEIYRLNQLEKLTMSGDEAAGLEVQQLRIMLRAEREWAWRPHSF